MSTALTFIFGSEIKVSPQPRRSQRQYAGYPGAHGLTALHLGSRGRTIEVRGRLRVAGAVYATARATLEAAVAVVEAWQWAAAEDLTYGGMTYYNCVMDSFRLLPGPDGKTYRFTSTHVLVDFVASFTELV